MNSMPFFTFLQIFLLYINQKISTERENILILRIQQIQKGDVTFGKNEKVRKINKKRLKYGRNRK